VSGLRIGEFELFWLHGGSFSLDGGAIFGVVPKILWNQKYPSDDSNTVPLRAWPILIRTPSSLILLETGLGNKLTEKQKKIFKVSEEWRLTDDLHMLSVAPDDIDFVILTHYDFDHAGGVIMKKPDGSLALTFPKAQHVLQEQEWQDVLNPNKRSASSYLPENIETLKDSNTLMLVNGTEEIVSGITLFQTGGHNRGHQVVRIESRGEVALHLGDLLPTHAHFNPLWVMSYDQFPIDAIREKEEWEERGLRENAWFTFYHDIFMQACRFDEKGQVIEKWIAQG